MYLLLTTKCLIQSSYTNQHLSWSGFI